MKKMLIISLLCLSSLQLLAWQFNELSVEQSSHSSFAALIQNRITELEQAQKACEELIQNLKEKISDTFFPFPNERKDGFCIALAMHYKRLDAINSQLFTLKKLLLEQNEETE